MDQKSWTSSTGGETEDLPHRFVDGLCGYKERDVEMSRFLSYTEDIDSFLFVLDGLEVAPNHYTPRIFCHPEPGLFRICL